MSRLDRQCDAHAWVTFAAFMSSRADAEPFRDGVRFLIETAKAKWLDAYGDAQAEPVT